MEDVVGGAKVMVFSKERIMKNEITDVKIQYPEQIDTPAFNGVLQQQIRIKFYPGLGYAPCINQESINRQNHLRIG